MSSTPVLEQPIGTTTGADGSFDHPIAKALDTVDSGIRKLANLDLATPDTMGLMALAVQVQRLTNLLHIQAAHLTSEIDNRGLHSEFGATSTRVLLRDLLLIAPTETSARLRLAETTRRGLTPTGSRLEPELPRLAEVLHEGRISPAHAAIITRTMDKLTTSLPPDVRDGCENILVEQAQQLDPPTLERVARKMLEAADPDGPDPDGTAHGRMELHLGTRRDDGLTRIWGLLDELTIEMLRTAISPLAAPQPAGNGETCTKMPAEATAGEADEPESGPTCNTPQGPSATPRNEAAGDDAGSAPPTDSVGQSAGSAPRTDTREQEQSSSAAPEAETGWHGQDPPDPAPAPPPEEATRGQLAQQSAADEDPALRDQRSPATRRAHALAEILDRYLRIGGGPQHGGERPQLIVTINEQDLLDQLGRADLGFGDTLSAGAARQLACDANILPVVLRGDSQVLDIGRRYVFPRQIRRAITIRDRGCAWPGCDRPAPWCDAHHIRWWKRDLGITSLDNGCLLCPEHHTQIHNSRWLIQLADDGVPEFIPPPWLDPLQQPRRNRMHRPLPKPSRPNR